MSDGTEAAPKAWRGRFYEDFAVGDTFRSRLGRTITTLETGQTSLDAVVGMMTGALQVAV